MSKKKNLRHVLRRSPHGERGLKFLPFFDFKRYVCRSPHGERGLKYQRKNEYTIAKSRSPHGERGLKYARWQGLAEVVKSLPSRGAWIEITRVN